MQDKFAQCAIPAWNPGNAQVRSPLRYPGGKNWLVPHVRHWLRARPRSRCLVEPFCGGASTSLTAIAEGLTEHAVLVEKDEYVAALWRAVLEEPEGLIERITRFTPTPDKVKRLEHTPLGQSVVEDGFRTLVLNRTRRGGILAPGASLIRAGEKGAGLTSRWYPQTLVRRIRAISIISDRLEFHHDDGMDYLEHDRGPDVSLFVDPPYTAGGKNAGRRLYAQNEVDHERMFAMLAGASSDFLATYDESEAIAELIHRHEFHAVRVRVRTTHHATVGELLITRQPTFPRAKRKSGRGPDLVTAMEQEERR